MSGVGYIKMYRSILDNPIVCKDSEVFAIWCYLLLEATHNEYETLFGNERIIVKKGQLITSRKSISNHFKINESKCERVFTLLKNEQMIEQQSSTKNRLITILNWDKYQSKEQQNELQVNNNRTTSEQQVNTNKNDKNDNNVKNDKNDTLKKKDTVEIDYAQVVSYLNQKSNKSFRVTDATKKLINARINEGFEIDDFYRVIDNQCEKWLSDDKMIDYLRPQTLFSNKFESYLNTIKKKKFDIMDL